MNPSASGWIKKLINDLNPEKRFKGLDIEALYTQFRDCGFIYGTNVAVINNWIDNNDLGPDEICKVNLIIALHIVYNNHKTDKDFYTEIVNYYNSIDEEKNTFIRSLIGSNDIKDKAERIINKRIQIDNNLINKSFNYFATNALLFVDVLTFRNYLKTGIVNENSFIHYESIIESIILNTLNIKTENSDYDNSLIKLFGQSLRYQRDRILIFNEAVKMISTNLFASYCLDLAAMATWTDNNLDNEAEAFLNQLGKNINLSQQHIDTAYKSINNFHNNYRDKVPALGAKNIVKTFYDNASTVVLKLIKRNSKRLTKELSDSKELLILLSQSTHRSLSKDEQKKVQDQLKDIFKTIPSLAIFLLPGGAILLPIVISFIPKLLPSAFDDNRINEEKE